MGRYMAVTVMVILCCLGRLMAQESGDRSAEAAKETVEKSRIADVFDCNSQVRKEADQKRWYYTFGGWYDNKTGNTELLRSNMQTELRFDDDIATFILSYMTFYTMINELEIENRGTGIVKFDYYILTRLELFVYSQSEFSNPQLLKYRNNTGAGAKFVFFRNPFWKMDASLAPIFQYEKYRSRDGRMDPRWSLRYRVLMTPFKQLTCTFVLFYIPKINNLNAYRFNTDTSAAVMILTNVSLKLGYMSQYNINALPGTKRLDETLYMQLQLNF
jgi:hypothetical protein